MRLRKLLLAAGAIALAGAMTLTPTAQAANPNGGPIATIVVGGNAGNAAHAMTLTMKATQLQTDVFGAPIAANCGAGAGTGTTFGGLLGIAPLSGQDINVLNLNCAGFFPGVGLTLTAVCSLQIVYADPNVHAGLVDVGVPGNAKFSAVDGTIHMTNLANPPAHCLRVTHANGCQFFIGGSTAVQFDETVKVVGGQNLQDLHLLGRPGLQVKNPNAACFGAFMNNAPITLTGIFNEHHVNGTVDFR